jgi:hypothetical protein
VPEYAAVEAVRGLSPDVIHVAGSKNLLSDIPWVQPAYLP